VYEEEMFSSGEGNWGKIHFIVAILKRRFFEKFAFYHFIKINFFNEIFCTKLIFSSTFFAPKTFHLQLSLQAFSSPSNFPRHKKILNHNKS
jgi:hypothetical protein